MIGELGDGCYTKERYDRVDRLFNSLFSDDCIRCYMYTRKSATALLKVPFVESFSIVMDADRFSSIPDRCLKYNNIVDILYKVCVVEGIGSIEVSFVMPINCTSYIINNVSLFRS